MEKPKSKKWIWIVPVLVLALLAGGFYIYTGRYYHADADALSALTSDETVTVTQTDFGWLFDGPSQSEALIFYPGAKVEETAYAPLLHRLAGEGMDVLLVKMPFRFAIFGEGKADGLLSKYEYDTWYIGGHSLGGVMAAQYAAEHSDALTGVILLASYPTKPLDDSLTVISICGSEDGVLNREKQAANDKNLPADAVTCVIEGGNHAQFGNYGEQPGDGEAAISAQEQQRQTAALILQNK